jgi:hypothetical protein
LPTARHCKHARSEAWQNDQFRVLAQDEHRLQLVLRAVARGEAPDQDVAGLGLVERTADPADVVWRLPPGRCNLCPHVP